MTSTIIRRTAITVVIAYIATSQVKAAKTTVAISHCNDVGGQIDRFMTNTSGSDMAPEPCPGNTTKGCVGGFVNVVHWMHDTASFSGLHANHIRLSTGNMIGGESGYIASMNSGWEEYGKLVEKHINANASTFGIKEFEAGISQTLAYMNVNENTTLTNFTIANACNVENYTGTEEGFCNVTQPVLQIVVPTAINSNKFTIGIIGFINPIVARLALTGKLKFEDIVESIQKTVDRKPDIKTFIAIGDGSLEIAKQILDTVKKVKIVIYGSRFFNTTDNLSKYPLKHKHGYIATAGRYGSSVGKMVVEIDDDTGEVTVMEDKSLLVVTSAPDTLNDISGNATSDLNDWYTIIAAKNNSKLGQASFQLKGGETCWRQECNLGNLLTDAVVSCALQTISQELPSPLFSVWHGGAFFENYVTSTRQVTEFDVHKWLPYHNNVHIKQIKGSDLRKVFALSATGIDPLNPDEKNWGQFLQVSSGIRVYYDTDPETNPNDWIVSGIRITQDKDGVPQLKDLDDNSVYVLAIPTYLYEGRGVYYSLDKKIWANVTGSNTFEGFDDDCLIKYIKSSIVTSAGLRQRIWTNREATCSCDCKGRKTWLTVILTIVFFSIFVAAVYIGYFYVVPRLRRSTNFSQD